MHPHPVATPSARQTLSLDHGWLFHLGDVEAPLANKHIAAYMANKAGYARGAAKPAFDDSDWRQIGLPHDWSVEGAFHPDNHVDAGFLPRGVAWYRRHFALDESDRSKHLSIRFDGVATYCTVYVNGHLLHRNWCGYTPFTIDITDVATFGEDLNTVAVRVDATHPEGWWYEGAGIYRHVWLTKTSPVHVATDGVFVRPARNDDGTWDTQVETTIENAAYESAVVELRHFIRDASGATVARQISPLRLPARRPHKVDNLLRGIAPALWSVDSPNLYTLHTEIWDTEDLLVDTCETSFGYRAIRFDPQKGFFLNNQPVRLLGTCNHQDHAGVGVAVPDSIHEFRVRRLKEMGCNAYRAAHNPPAPELLDACDRLGMLVIDENRNFGSSPEHLAQLETMVRRDRNHPSVILWSVCNEEAVQGTPVGGRIASAMQHAVRELDPSRPVTAAVSGGILNDGAIGDVIEVLGINYQLPQHDAARAKWPAKPLLASETHCVLSTRGIYATDPERKYFSSLDTDAATWGSTARETWRGIVSRPFVAGLFVWTGFDYRGEPSPHDWPCVNSRFGLMDVCGFPKAGFWLHKAWWTREPFVHVEPHWNGRPGEAVRVHVYTNCDEAELLLNGRSLGRKPVNPIEMAAWDLAFEAGTLKALGYRGGERVAETVLETTGEPVALGLEIPAAAPAGADVLPVTAFAVDSRGRRVPTANVRVAFAVEGVGKILGVGDGDPTCLEPDRAASRSLFNGLAQVVVHVSGRAQLTATADGLRSATLDLPVPAIRPSAAVPAATRRHWVKGWLMSPVTSTRPTALAPSAQDMNTWQRVEPGSSTNWGAASGYAVYRATVKPPKSVRKTGGRVAFHGTVGEAEFFLDGRPVRTTPSNGPGTRTIDLEANRDSLELAVIIHANQASGGLSGRVEIVPL